MRKFLLSVVMLLSLSVAKAQLSPEQIYKSLEYRTDEFNDIKPSWLIHDSHLIRDVFIRFSNEGYIRSNGRPLSEEERKAVLVEIYDGQISLLVTQRMFDNELESLLFNSPSTPLDTLSDCVLLRSVLSSPNDTYSVIKAKQYSFTDITKEEFNNDPRFSFDIFLHPLEPRLLLWHTISRAEKKRSEVSFFGRLGNDYLNTPFWFKGTFVYGFRYAYVDDVRRASRDNERYTIFAGVETPINFSGQLGDPTSRSNIFKNRKLEATGAAVFVGGSYAIESVNGLLFQRSGMKVQLEAELSLALARKQSYPVNVDSVFASIRNSLTLAATLKNIGLFYTGVGLSYFDVHNNYYFRLKSSAHTIRFVNRERFKLTHDTLFTLGQTESHLLPFVKLGVAEKGSLFGIDLSSTFNYDFSRGYGFVAVRSLLTFSDMFGFDIRYFRAINKNSLPAWQDESYFVPAFFFRLNY